MKLPLCLTFVFLFFVQTAKPQETSLRPDELDYQVGRWRDDVIVTPVNQLLTPYGKQVELAGMRPQALALSPNGKLLLVAGKTN